MGEAGAGQVQVRGIGMVDRREQPALGDDRVEIDRGSGACRGDVAQRSAFAKREPGQVVEAGHAVQAHRRIRVRQQADGAIPGLGPVLDQPQTMLLSFPNSGTPLRHGTVR